MDKRQYMLTVALAVVAGLVGGVVSSWLFMGAPVVTQKTPQVAEVVGAERFEVVDKDGKLRAALWLDNGEPNLVLADKTGKIRAKLSLADGKPALWLADKNGKPRAGLSLLNEEPTLVLADKTGKTRAVLGYTEIEAIPTGGTEKRPVSSLVLSDKEGKVIWSAP